MEITNCEQYVLDELKASRRENYRLREELDEMRRREKERGSDVGTEQREVEMYKINEPYETAYLTIKSAYDFAHKDKGLGMTAAEIREALETEEGLREICEKRVGWSNGRIVDVELRVWPYQLRALNQTYVLDIYSGGDGVLVCKVEMSDEVRTSRHYPAGLYDELYAYGLEEAREALLEYAEKLEETER